MQIFRYKARNTKYVYMLILPLLSLTSITLALIIRPWNIAPALAGVLIIFSPFFAVLIYALHHLLERIAVKSDKAVFAHLFSRNVSFSEISEIRAAKKVDIGIELIRKKGGSTISYIRIREPAQDILTYRQAIHALLTQARLANPSIVIQPEAWQVAEPESELAQRQAQQRAGILSTVKGLGGWLLFLAFGLVANGITDVREIVKTLPVLFQFSIFSAEYCVALAHILLYSTTFAVALAAFIQLMRKKALFKQTYIQFLGIGIIIQIINLAIGYLTGATVLTLMQIFTVPVSLAYSVVGLLAWRAYMRLSVRVKNTLVK